MKKGYIVVLIFILTLLNCPNSSLGATMRRSELEKYGQVVWEVPMKEKLIAITFDDGPDPVYTPQVLEVLKKYNAKATFFIVGEYAQKYPEVVEREWREGHDVGNHTFTHVDMYESSLAIINKEITATDKLIYVKHQPELKLFRPPLGNVNRRLLQVAKSQGYKIVLWSWHQDTRDWSGRKSSPMVKQVLGGLRNGDIILFHDAGGERVETVKALKILLPELKRRGYTCVTVSQLLKHDSRYKGWFPKGALDIGS